jgi:hypothetical protein
MLAVLDCATRHAIVLARPLPEVNHLTSLGAKWPEAVRRRHVDRLLANRTPHRAHLNRKLPDSRAARKSSIVRVLNRYPEYSIDIGLLAAVGSTSRPETRRTIVEDYALVVTERLSAGAFVLGADMEHQARLAGHD